MRKPTKSTTTAVLRAEKHFVDTYLARRPEWERLRVQLVALLTDYRLSTSREGVVHSVKSRIKEYDSLRQKALKNPLTESLDPERVFEHITDVIGARIVCHTLQGRGATCSWVRQLGEAGAIEILDEVDWNKPTGYRSHHFLIRINDTRWPGLHAHLSDVAEQTIELQVRTLLEEAWGEVEHRLVYKSESEVPDHLQATIRALSSRLHDCDLTVEHVHLSLRKHPTIRVHLPSYEIDPGLLNVSKDVEEQIRAAIAQIDEAHRRDDYEAAKKVRRDRLIREPIGRALEAADALADFRAEEAFDYLRAAQHHMRVNWDRAKRELHEAERKYARAELETGAERNPFMPFRRSQIANWLGEHDRAIEFGTEALKRLTMFGTPPFYRRELHIGTVKRLLAVYHTNTWREAGSQSPLDAAEALDVEAVDYFRERLRDADNRGRAELAREFMLSANNLAYLLWLSRERDPTRLHTAASLVNEILTRVPEEIRVANCSVLDTMLTISTESLSASTPPEEFVRLDGLRQLILERLAAPTLALSRTEVEEVLGHLSDFEARWAQRLRWAADVRFGTVDSKGGT